MREFGPVPYDALPERQLQNAVPTWDKILDAMPPEKAAVYGASAVAELDGLWRAAGREAQECAFSGFAYWQDTIAVKAGSEGPSAEMKVVDEQMGHVKDRRGTSRGFTFVDLFGGGQPRLWHLFETPGEKYKRFTYVRATEEFVALPVAPFEEPFEDSELPAVVKDSDRINEQLSRRAADLLRWLGSPRFDLLRHVSKVQMMDHILKKVGEEAGIKGAKTSMLAEYAYLPAGAEEAEPRFDVMLPMNGTPLSGTCVGLTIPDYMRFRRRENSLLTRARHDGLSLLVEVAKDWSPRTFQLDYGRERVIIGPGNVLSVPIPGQNLQVTFDRPDRPKPSQQPAEG